MNLIQKFIQNNIKELKNVHEEIVETNFLNKFIRSKKNIPVYPNNSIIFEKNKIKIIYTDKFLLLSITADNNNPFDIDIVWNKKTFKENELFDFNYFLKPDSVTIKFKNSDSLDTTWILDNEKSVLDISYSGFDQFFIGRLNRYELMFFENGTIKEVDKENFREPRYDFLREITKMPPFFISNLKEFIFENKNISQEIIDMLNLSNDINVSLPQECIIDINKISIPTITRTQLKTIKKHKL